MCILCADGNDAAANLGYTDILYTIKRLVEHAILSFLVFLPLSKSQIFQILLNSTDLESFHSKIVVLRMSPKLAKKASFVVYYF